MRGFIAAIQTTLRVSGLVNGFCYDTMYDLVGWLEVEIRSTKRAQPHNDQSGGIISQLTGVDLGSKFDPSELSEVVEKAQMLINVVVSTLE